MKQNEYTTPFGIAHYILLVAITALCAGLIIYAIYWGPHTTGNHTTPSPRPTPVPTQCAQDTATAVVQMWAYHPEFVPTKYHTIALEYIATPTEITFRGICEDTEFTCQTGQARGDCDPCAYSDAITTAMDAHITDAVVHICGTTEE